MSGEAPLVSAIITTYKREAEIVERAIRSIEEQTYRNIEVLVVDDNPNDSKYSRSVMEMCRLHPTVRYIKQNGNKGACAARNLGIVNANGMFIGCLDDDDLWLPEKIEKQLNVFQKDKDGKIGVVYCNGVRKDEDTGKETPYNSDENFREKAMLSELLGWDNIGSTSHPLIRRKCFRAVGYFWEEQPARQDYEMWIRILHAYEEVGINEKLFVHYIHLGDQISKNKKRAYIGYRNIYRRYRDEYRKNPKAEKRMLHNIVANRTGITPAVIFYIARYYLLDFKIRYYQKRS